MSNCCSDNTCDNHKRSFVDLMDHIGAREVIVGEHSVAATNGEFGGWVKTKHNSYVSIEYAKTLNRAQRRAEGIKL